MHSKCFEFFSLWGRGRVKKICGRKGKKYCTTCKVTVHYPYKERTITFYMHSKGRNEKAKRWGLQLCFGLSIFYKMGHSKDATREVGAS